MLPEAKYLSLAPFYVLSLFDIDLKQSLAASQLHASPVHLPKGHVFLQPGEIVREIYLLHTGVIVETTTNPNGLEKGTLIFPTYPLGLFGLFHQQEITYTCRALTPCQATTIDRIELLSLLQSNRPFLNDILNLFALEVRNTNNALLRTASYSTNERIFQVIYFYHLTSKYYPPLTEIHLSQQLIATLAGVHRTSVHHALAILEQQQILRRHGKALAILQPERLFALAFGSFI